MAKLNNIPDTRSLEQRVFQYLKRHPNGVQRPTIDRAFRNNTMQEVDGALNCLKQVHAVFCTNGVWWPK